MLKKITIYISLLVVGLSFAIPLQAEQIEGTPGTAFKSEIISMQQILYYHSQQPPDTSLPAKSKKFHLGIPSDNEIGSGSTIRSPYVPRFQPMGGASPTFSPEPTASFGSIIDNNRTIPPDVHGAVGPDHLMTTHNSEVRIQNKSGSIQSTIALNSFWASVATSTFDPRVYYDPYEEKWFSLACGTAGGQSAILAGASYTSSPSSTWSMHAMDADPGDTTWFDYPSVGFNKKWIVVTGNMFRNVTNAFEGTVVYVIDKMKLYNDRQLSYTKFSFDNSLGYFTIVPHETFDENLENMYMFCTWNGNSGGKSYFRMFHISGSVGSEVFNNNSIYTESNNTFAWSVSGEGSCPQLGTTREIIANDARIQNAVYRDGSVWFTLTAQVPATAPTRASVLWYEVDVSGGQPVGTALQEGKIDDANDVFHYAFPSITVNKNNDALIGYTSFSPNQYASCNYSFRSESDGLNSMRSTHNYKSGLASYYKTYGSGRNRWGDYSQTMIDPDDEVSFWTLQEYAEVPGDGRDRWGTWWAKVCGTPQTPTSITQPSTHCVGTEESYSTGSTGDADTYNWTIQGTDWSVGASTTTAVDVTAGTGSATLSVSAENDCGSTDQFSIVITPEQLAGDAGTINGPDPHCASTTETYSVDAIANADSYTWVISGNGWSGSSTTNSIDITSGNGSGTITVTGDNVCGSGTETVSEITPLLIPDQPGTISGSAIHCAQTSATYSIDEIENADSYTWTVDGVGWSGTSTTNEIVLTAGNALCSLSVSAVNVCGSSIDRTITIDPLLIPDQPGTINEPALHCTATTETYSISPVIRADEYVWTISNPAWSGTSTSTDIDITSASGSSTVTVAAVNACGSSLVSSVVAEATDLPNAPLTLDVPNGHCTGEDETYTASEVTDATSYVWTVQGNGWSGSSTTNVCVITAGSGDGIIRAAAVNACGTGPSINRTIPSIQIPNDPSPIVGPNAHCKNGTGFYSVDDQNDADSYAWTVTGDGWSGSGDEYRIHITAGAGAGVLTCAAVNACGTGNSVSRTIDLLPIPSAPTTIDTVEVHCVGKTETYETNSVAGATSYVWTIEGEAWEGSSSTNEIELTAGSGSVKILVQAANACGASSSKSIVVYPTLTLGETVEIITPDIHCSSDIAHYSVPLTEGALSYYWLVGGTGWSGSSITNSIDVMAGNSEGTLSIAAVNVCGSGTPRNISITPSKKPGKAGSITLPETHCEGTEQTYSIDEIDGADSYYWNINGTNWTGSSTENNIVITAGEGSAVISASAVNACGSGTPTAAEAASTAYPTSSFSANMDTVFIDQSVSVHYTGNADDSAEFTWAFDGGTYNSGIGIGPHQVYWSEIGTKEITLTVSVNECASEASVTKVEVIRDLHVDDDKYTKYGITILPNPNKGSFTLQIDNLPAADLKIIITDISGKSVADYKFNHSSGVFSHNFDLNNLSNGNYFLTIQFKGEEIVRQIILKK